MHSHQDIPTPKEEKDSLNPCFNGRCTRTSGSNRFTYTPKFVLILVLMEDALARVAVLRAEQQYHVLILVLMEDALALIKKGGNTAKAVGLNPCFNGRCTRTYSKNIQHGKILSLNPCFNGRCTRTITEFSCSGNTDD